MSARLLAQAMAEARSEFAPSGYLVAGFSVTSSPLELRDHLEAFYVLRDVCAAERRELDLARAPLGQRIMAAQIAREIEVAINAAHLLLVAIARRGGRGFPPRRRASVAQGAA